MAKTTSTPPTEFLDYLGREFVCRPLSAVERLIVEETWAMASIVPKPSPPTIEEIATAHAKFGDPLLERLHFVRGVTHRTLGKMSGVVPPELKWAASPYSPMSINGIVRADGYHREGRADITSQIKSGKTLIRESDAVRVTSMDASGRATIKTDIPLASLSSDPMIIAQATRKACRAHAEKLDAEAYTVAKQERTALAAKIAKLQAELVELDEDLVIKAAEEQVRADEITARATALAKERAAERAARRAAQLAEHTHPS